jgi:6-phosphogluconolactonase (cycloisomerase 2 family)
VDPETRSVSAYRTDATTGALQHFQTVPWPNTLGSPYGPGVRFLSVDSTNRYAYLTPYVRDTSPLGREKLEYFDIHATSGALAPAAVSPLTPSPGSPGPLATDPNRSLAYLVSSLDGCLPSPDRCNFGLFQFVIQTFSIDVATGALVATERRRYPQIVTDEFTGISDLQIDPSGKFGCVAKTQVDQLPAIFCFAIDATTGAFSSLLSSWRPEYDWRNGKVGGYALSR